MRVLTAKQVRKELQPITNPVWRALSEIGVGQAITITSDEVKSPTGQTYQYAKKWNKKFTVNKINDGWMIIRKA